MPAQDSNLTSEPLGIGVQPTESEDPTSDSVLKVALAGVRTLGVFAEVGVATSVDTRPTTVSGVEGADLARRTSDRLSLSRHGKTSETKTERGNSEKFLHRADATTGLP